MKQLIPQQFLFRLALRCGYVAKMPCSGRHVVELSRDRRLAFPGAMDGMREFGELRVGWNEHGLGLQWEAPHKQEPIYGEVGKPKACDGLSVWIDTRDTRTIHRATRHCQRFTLMVHNGADPPTCEAVRFPIHRAIEDAPQVDLSQIRIARFGIDADGDLFDESAPGPIKAYRMEAFLPATVLYGFDPDTNRRLGFCYRLRDRELGDQFLAPGPEFPYWEDPSLWSVLELAP